MCYWVLTVSDKVVVGTPVQYVIFTDLIDPEIKRRIEKFYEELKKWMDGMNSVDYIRDYLYIDDVEEAGEAALGDGANTPSGEAYVDIIGKRAPQTGRH